MKKISVIIVNYNSGTMLKKCILSIFKNIKCGLIEVVVVDNASIDDSISEIIELDDERIHIIKSKNNLGFAKANNIGVDNSSGEILFFLNPDTLIIDPNINNYLPMVSNDRIYTSNLVNETNQKYKNTYTFPTIRDYISRLFKIRSNAVWAQGSVIIMTRNTYFKVGKWPEDYFMYSEDLDLCYRSYKMGIFLEVLPFTIMHVGGGTTKNIWTPRERALKVEKSYYKFCVKYSLLLDYHLLHFLNFLRQLPKNYKEAMFNFSIYLSIFKEKHI